MLKLEAAEAELFPAQAGVILQYLELVDLFLTFPRTGGGDPNYTVFLI